MPNLILFGAGASYGSDIFGTPPLGSALFEALCRFNPPGWGKLPESLSADFNRDFEGGMTKLAEINPHAMPVLQRAMAAFFFNFLPSANSLYLALARRIRSSSWQGSMGTLNYERLLELALGAVGVQPVVGQSAVAGQIELCLPHGCCHIFCDGVRMSGQGVSFSGVGVTMDGQISVVAEPDAYHSRIQNDAVPPVMSYFEPRKTTTAGASFIRGQRERWSDLAAAASTIAIVGARVRESDSHIWEPIAKSAAKLVYCAGEEAGKEFKAWAVRERAHREDLVFTGYFRDHFDSICVEIGM